MRSGRLALGFMLLFAAVSMGLSGCTPAGPEFIDSGSNYTTATVSAVLDAPAPKHLSNLPDSDAVGLRHDALVALRAGGGDSARSADLLTEIFPADTQAVPYRVEYATLGNVPVLVVAEVVGTKDELDKKRLWVLSEDGDVLLSAQR